MCLNPQHSRLRIRRGNRYNHNSSREVDIQSFFLHKLLRKHLWVAHYNTHYSLYRLISWGTFSVNLTRDGKPFVSSIK